ncbi:MAG: carboxymuconolactone decarboxylase family protein [Acidimicrobiia bacterium]
MEDEIKLTEAGRRAAVEMFGDEGPDRMEASFVTREQDVDRSWAEISSGWVLNGMYARHVLPTSTRELCAVAALTALGHHGELSAHIGIALRSNPPKMVREVILQMAVYAGMPPMYEALRLYDVIVNAPDFVPFTNAEV